jgi:hypothetical protein
VSFPASGHRAPGRIWRAGSGSAKEFKHREQAIPDLRPEPDEAYPVTNEFARLPQGGRRDPYRGEQVPAEEQGQALGVDLIVLQAGRGGRLRLLRVREDGLMAESFE